MVDNISRRKKSIGLSYLKGPIPTEVGIQIRLDSSAQRVPAAILSPVVKALYIACGEGGLKAWNGLKTLLNYVIIGAK